MIRCRVPLEDAIADDGRTLIKVNRTPIASRDVLRERTPFDRARRIVAEIDGGNDPGVPHKQAVGNGHGCGRRLDDCTRMQFEATRCDDWIATNIE